MKTPIELDRYSCNWIGGERVQGTAAMEVENPATGRTIARVPDLEDEAVDRAIESAGQAFDSWSRLPAGVRAGYLNEWAQRLLDHSEELASLLTLEQGKPLVESRGEIAGAAAIIRWYAEEGKRAYGEIIPASNEGQQLLVYREAAGVVGLITPMNFPAATVARKVAPALAAGCTLVLKPAETTPLTAIALFDHLMATGIPAGAANLVTGEAARIGARLMAHPAIRKISFTGSTRIGKLLMEQAARTVKKVSLELGGNSPVIVFPDADPEKAAADIVANKFENCGQVCNGINRIYVHEDIRDAFVAALLSRVRRLRTGPGLSEGADVGPLISGAALAKVERLVGDAVAKGGELLAGGRRLQAEPYADGYFYAPTLIAGVTGEMDIAREEIFGPVAPVLAFRTEEEVVAAANDTDYGLAAYVYTQNFARIHRMIRVLKTGNIGVNGTSLAYPQAPFGGVKESGIGREGGRQGLEEYTVLKYVALTTE
ncbi:NAD-dependent succinate-semialdehyde dehydrogenase [Cohnella algarum]|uniref:NAD-dependent succinate-semialdehyde dehydrogenase n=1 Tax=Cohnella algarum TaxID=2044859 RepID=UPI001967ECE7|nr:NAD-dependent succinate-semialdehyde dehydrogenase [Cohnella algarum]MBN2979967.1 NAD-dependent succinate-semialdehyde dehydrogenase [Cohnella algarum]